MKSLMPSTLLAVLFVFGAAHPAATDPVGYVSLGDTTGGPAVKAQTDVAISIPLERPAEFAGTVASATAIQLTISGTPGFAANEYATVSTPYVVKFESGPREGLSLLIGSNTSNTLTLSVPAGESLTGVSGSVITIRRAWTVQSLMAGNTVPPGTQLLARSGNTAGINLATDLVFEFNGVYWEDTFTLEVVNSLVLYTNEGLILRNPTNTPIPSLVVSGEVPVSRSRVLLSKLSAAAQDNWIAYVSPVGESLAESGLGSIAVIGDQVHAFDNSQPGMNKSATQIAEWNGSYWEDVFTAANVSSTFMLGGGQAFVYRRAASAPIGDQVWSDQPMYVSSL